MAFIESFSTYIYNLLHILFIYLFIHTLLSHIWLWCRVAIWDEKFSQVPTNGQGRESTTRPFNQHAYKGLILWQTIPPCPTMLDIQTGFIGTFVLSKHSWNMYYTSWGLFMVSSYHKHGWILLRSAIKMTARIYWYFSIIQWLLQSHEIYSTSWISTPLLLLSSRYEDHPMTCISLTASLIPHPLCLNPSHWHKTLPTSLVKLLENSHSNNS